MAAPLHRVLAGSDGPGRRALPAGELLHPVPLAALVVLVLNDHWLKGADLVPGAVTGKLSDVAGLLFFPLLLTAAGDLVLLACARWLGAAVDFSLRRWKLVAACTFTAALFAAIKLSPAAAAVLIRLLGTLGVDAAVAADPTDLFALPMVGLAYALGVAEIRRVPLGRLEVVERAWRRGRRDAAAAFDDVGPAGPTLGRAFAGYLETGQSAEATAALTSIRESTAARACPRSSPPSDRTRTSRRTGD